MIGQHNSQVFADKPGQVEAGRWLIEHLRDEWVVLDVGCGTGIPTARQLADAGCTVVGVDSSPAKLEIARRNVPEAILFERSPRDLRGLHPRQGRFDGATAFFSLLLLGRAASGEALDAIRGVLAAEAVFALGTTEDDPHELESLLSHHGFTVESITAERSVRSTADTPQQTHLYARCFVTPAM